MSNVLVTGGAGFIGSHLVEALSKAGHRIVVVDVSDANVDEMFASGADFRFLKGSSVDRPLLEHVIEAAQIEEVVHLSGVSNTVDTALGQVPAFLSGFIGLATIYDVIQTLQKKGTSSVQRVSIASSSLTSGVWLDRTHKFPVPEDAVRNDATTIDISKCYHPYVDGKIAMELLCHSNWQQFKIPFTIMRFATLYGPRMNRNVVTWYFVRNVLQGKPMQIHGDGSQKRQHMYVTDLADAIALMIGKRKQFSGSTVSIVPAQMTSMLELAQAVQQAVPGSTYELVPSRAIDLKVDKIAPPMQLFSSGWSIKHDLVSGLRETVEYYRRRPELWEDKT